MRVVWLIVMLCGMTAQGQESSMKYWSSRAGDGHSEESRRERLLSDSEKWDGLIEMSLSSFEDKDYAKSVYYYEKSIKYPFYDSNLEYGIGLVYYKLWETTGKNKYRRKAVRVIEKSLKHENYKAFVWLEKYKK